MYVLCSGVNDLSVDMGLDPETATMLRDVAARKDAAVASEDFELVGVTYHQEPPCARVSTSV